MINQKRHYLLSIAAVLLSCLALLAFHMEWRLLLHACLVILLIDSAIRLYRTSRPLWDARIVSKDADAPR